MKIIKLTNTDEPVMVDDEDYPILSRLTWYKSDMGYAMTDTPVKHLKMHKLIIGPIPVKAVIDHIDRNKLNNQKKNLRVVDQADNVRNSDRYDTSRFFYYDTQTKKWTIDSRSLGVRNRRVKSLQVARRTVSRLKLGFPIDVAIAESEHPTISITNWKQFGIMYDDYIEAQKSGMSIKMYRRKKIGGKLGKRGPANK